MLVFCAHNVSGGGGQSEGEATSTAWRAAQPYATLVELDELAGKRQAQTRALLVGCAGRFRLAERGEDQRLIFCPDSNTAIADGYDRLDRVDLSTDTDVTTGRSELHGI